ncbi:hypothetical protein [Chlorogloeopsis sp. ULAP01]|uniref:hypothetical protein n=1 Tax=Chlorogloeopsis sp. ULAP01 TaxID=3056483 RepID=UPI0025ABDDFF|nr:hypothetical protein [Chlorogloeopsis sp. ULAP01]
MRGILPAILRQYLTASGGQNVVQLGKYNVNLGEGKDIHIGDKVYQGTDAETIRAIFLDVLSQNTQHKAGFGTLPRNGNYPDV